MNTIQTKSYNIYNKATNTALKIIFIFTLLLLVTEKITSELLVLIFGSINLGTLLYLDLSFYDQFFWTVIMGPLAETVIFHFIIMEVLLYLFRNVQYKDFWVIFISALIFGFSHFYSIDYVIITFFGGMILSTAYIVAKNRKMIPFVIVFFVHALYNFVSLLEYGYKNNLIF